MKTLKEILIAEATEHDFKLKLEENNPVSWLKSVSAFANGLGGSLYFGVDDKGAVTGLDDAEYSANALMLVQNGIDFMRKHYKMMWKKSGMHRVEYPDYPQEALREALVNAIIHRDYSVMGSEVHIDIYDDRIEITSPGGMYDNRPIQELDLDFVPSTRRNPCVADIFQRIDYAERRGSGLKKIRRGYNSAFDRQPKFSSTEFWFKTVLFNLNYGLISDDDETAWEIANSTDNTVNGGNGTVNGANGTVNGANGAINGADSTANITYDAERGAFLDLIKREPTISLDKISAKIGMSQRTLDRIVAELKNNGTIKRVGSKRTGHWEIIVT